MNSQDANNIAINYRAEAEQECLRDRLRAVTSEDVETIEDVLRQILNGSVACSSSHKEWSKICGIAQLLWDHNFPYVDADYRRKKIPAHISELLREHNPTVFARLVESAINLRREFSPAQETQQPEEERHESSAAPANPPGTEANRIQSKCVDTGGIAFFSVNAGHWTPVYDSMKRSLAYRTLTHASKLVLFEMLRVFNREFGKDPVRVMQKGFNFTFSHCDEDVGKSTFDGGVDAIVERKFFTEQYFENSGKPKWFIPSNGWKTWSPNETRANSLGNKVAAKTASIRRNHRFNGHTVEFQ